MPVGNFDPLRQGAEVVSTVAAIWAAHPAPGGFCEVRKRRRCDGLAGAFEGGRRPVGIDLRLITKSAQVADPLLQGLVVQVGDAVLNGIVEALEPSIGLGGLSAQFGNQRPTPLGPFVAAVKQRPQNLLQPLGI